MFNCVEFKLHTVLTAPLHMFVDPNQQDFLLGQKFMQYSNFFFDIIIKSMAQYLINTGRIKVMYCLWFLLLLLSCSKDHKVNLYYLLISNVLWYFQMSRHERFHADLLENIDKLVTVVEPSYILQQPMQTHIFNKNLALFLKVFLLGNEFHSYFKHLLNMYLFVAVVSFVYGSRFCFPTNKEIPR